MANLDLDAHWGGQNGDADPIEAAASQAASGQLGVGAYGDAVAGRIDIEHVERRGRTYAEALALADGEVEDAVVAAEEFAAGGDEFPGGLRYLFALLFKIGGEELLVVAAGDEADLLRVGLLGQSQAVRTGDFADLGLGQAAQRKERARQLLLREAEEEVGLVLGEICGPLENPAPARGVELVDRVVAGGDAAGADGAGGEEQLVELEVVVAERAGNRRAAGQVFIDERPDHIALEALLLVDDVVGDAEVLGDSAGVVDIVQRTTPACLGRVGNAVTAGQAGLVPKLEGEADYAGAAAGLRVALVGEHGRNRRGVYPSGHGYGDGCVLRHEIF